MKKMISLITVSIICVTISNPAFALSWQEEYPWAVDSVGYCIENGILSGDENGDLMLSGNLTRAQMAKIFTDTFNLTTASKIEFPDVMSDDWSYD